MARVLKNYFEAGCTAQRTHTLLSQPLFLELRLSLPAGWGWQGGELKKRGLDNYCNEVQEFKIQQLKGYAARCQELVTIYATPLDSRCFAKPFADLRSSDDLQSSRPAAISLRRYDERWASGIRWNMTKELSLGSEDSTKQSSRCPGLGSLYEQADQARTPRRPTQRSRSRIRHGLLLQAMLILPTQTIFIQGSNSPLPQFLLICLIQVPDIQACCLLGQQCSFQFRRFTEVTDQDV